MGKPKILPTHNRNP